MLQALRTFAQDTPELYTVSPSDEYLMNTAVDDGTGAGLLIGLVLGLLLSVVMVAGMWKVFTKAGKPGWAAIVPIYNTIVLLEIIGRPLWWIAFYLLAAIPFIGWIGAVVVAIINTHDLSKSFGKGAGMTVLLILLPFIGYPMLGFGDAKYVGPAAAEGANSAGAAPTTPAAPAA